MDNDDGECDFNRVMILIRGVPGSGKTTFAEWIMERTNWISGGYPAQVCADRFMVNDQGMYEFNTVLLEAAHKGCIAMAEQYLKDDRSPVIVHNTFSRDWEMEPYRALAECYGAQLFVIEMSQQFENVHDVPEEVVNQMKERFER